MLTTIAYALATTFALLWLWLLWEAKNAPQDPSEIGEQEGGMV